MNTSLSVYTPLEVLSVIRFLYAKHKTPTEIVREISEVYGSNAISRKQISVWCKKFDEGVTSVTDMPRSGRPNTERVDRNIERLEKLIYSDRRLKIREIAEMLDLSRSTVHRITHEDLKFKKVCSRWVPKQLTDEHKRQRLDCARRNLERLATEPNFLQHIITGDETWVHYDTPETKRDSMTWKHVDSPVTKKFKKSFSVKKVMASVFWDVRGIVLIEFLPRGETINADRYIETLKKVRDKIRFGRKRRGRLQAQTVRLLHDNATPHTAHKTKAWLDSSKWNVMDHPPHSPDLAPSDFHLFGPLKHHLGGKKFEDDESLQAEVKHFFQEKGVRFFEEGILKLKKRWEKCIEIGGDYVEK